MYFRRRADSHDLFVRENANYDALLLSESINGDIHKDSLNVGSVEWITEVARGTRLLFFCPCLV